MNLMVDVDEDGDNTYHGQKEESYEHYKKILGLPNNFDNLPPEKQMKLIMTGIDKYKEETKGTHELNPYRKTYKNLNPVFLENRQPRSNNRTSLRRRSRAISRRRLRPISRHTTRSNGGTRKNTKSRYRKQ